MIEGHRQGGYDAQGNVQKGVVGWCGCVFFCSVGVVVFSAVAHGGLCAGRNTRAIDTNAKSKVFKLETMRYFGP